MLAYENMLISETYEAAIDRDYYNPHQSQPVEGIGEFESMRIGVDEVWQCLCDSYPESV